MAKTYANYIDGEWVRSQTNEIYSSINPANTEEILGHFQQSNKADVENAIKAADKACPIWSQTAAPSRSDVIFRPINLLEVQKEELAMIIRNEVGKSYLEATGVVDK